MIKRDLAKIALFIFVAILLSNAIVISRDYQDSWVLEGVEISFTLFVMTYILAFFYEKKTLWMVTLAIVGRTTFLLIPNLKYVQIKLQQVRLTTVQARTLDDIKQFQ